MKPGGKTSTVWEIFKKTDDKQSVTCMICKKTFKFAGNTTNMKRHLRAKHPLQENPQRHPSTSREYETRAISICTENVDDPVEDQRISPPKRTLETSDDEHTM